MRRVRYQVACSLDGFIAGPDGGFDWIPPKPSLVSEGLEEGRRFDEILLTLGL